MAAASYGAGSVTLPRLCWFSLEVLDTGEMSTIYSKNQSSSDANFRLRE